MKMLHEKIVGCSKRGASRGIYNFNYGKEESLKINEVIIQNRLS